MARLRRAAIMVAVVAAAAWLAHLATTPADLVGPSAGRTLLMGWMIYPARVAPRITLNWDGILAFLVPLVALTLGGHFFLAWLYASIKSGSPVKAAATSSWRVRWTAVLVGSLVLSFAAIISSGLVFHQVGWLLTSPRSAYEPVAPCQYTPILLGELAGNVEFGKPPKPIHPDWLACIQFLPIVDDRGDLQEVVAYARDPSRRAETGICVVRPEGQETRPAWELERTLAEEVQPWTGPRLPLRSLGWCGAVEPRRSETAR